VIKIEREIEAEFLGFWFTGAVPIARRKVQEGDLPRQSQQLSALSQLDGNTCGVVLADNGLERLMLLPCR
jgi:hypothetical protein